MFHTICLHKLDIGWGGNTPDKFWKLLVQIVESQPSAFAKNMVHPRWPSTPKARIRGVLLVFMASFPHTEAFCEPSAMDIKGWS